jgi:hypothetical protein
LELIIDSGVLTRVVLEVPDCGFVGIDRNSTNCQYMDSLKERMFAKVVEIDDCKFRRMFPEWDVIEDRNDKLEELLGLVDQRNQVVERKKFFWGLF